MLVLSFVKEEEVIDKPKRLFRRKESNKIINDIKRETIQVNGKNVMILELPFSRIEDADVLKLLNVYKGRVLVSKEKSGLPILQNVLFKPDKYFQRALISSLANQIKSFNREWKTVCVKMNNFDYFKEFNALVKASKRVVFMTEETTVFKKFKEFCYFEYGAVVEAKEKCDTTAFDVFLDLDEIDKNGKLMIFVNNKESVLYPDATYFFNSKDFEKLSLLGIDGKIVCAAFGKNN